MIDRVSFGLDFNISNKVTNFLSIPFSYKEDPCIGSKFSNPLITLCLTIISYITKQKTLERTEMDEMIKIIKSEYDNTPTFLRKFSEINTNYQALGISISIDDLEMSNQLTDFDINKIVKNNYFLKLFSNKICYEQIVLETEKSNISGVDLFMSFNISNRSGFT